MGGSWIVYHGFENVDHKLIDLWVTCLSKILQDNGFYSF